ncbi:MAG: response regulator [Wujia sp.]
MNKRIMVIDDDIMNLKMADFILSNQQYEVVKAESGMEALSVLFRKSFDLILLDIEMPIMNGFKTLKEIRERGINTPVLFLTAADDVEAMIADEKCDVCGYIKKPFMPMDFTEKVSEILGK